MSDSKPRKMRRRALGSRFSKPVSLLILSDGGPVSKSPLVLRLLYNRYIGEDDPFVGKCNWWVTEDGVHVGIRDMAKEEMSDTLGKVSVQYAHVAMLLFDVTNRNSFDALEEYIDHFLKELREGNPLPFVLVATKRDPKSQRVVTTQEAQEFAAAHDAPYIETNARTGENVREAFEQAVKLAFGSQNDNVGEEDGHNRCTVQ